MDYKEYINEFLIKKTNKKKIIVIYWPTWSWKTDMSIDIARYLNTEIISTDSRQIFKYMNIWTWKITEDEKRWVKHHMLDIIEPNQSFSVWEFKNRSEKIISRLFKENKIPMLVGWTWLYIDSLIFGFDIPKIPADEKLRRKLEKKANEEWKEYIFNKLKKIDSNYDKNLHPNNLRYVIRAIEVKILTWKSKTSFKWNKKLKYDVLFLEPYYKDREYLYNRINKRVKMMFDMWLINEVKNLLNKGYKKNDFWMKSIWYEEIIKYINWKILLKESINQIQQNSRNYAKRQITWFNKYKKFI